MATLVAGGAGFIGSFLCERLVRQGQTVICVDNLITGRLDNVAHLRGNPRFTLLRHDITQPIAAAQSLDRIYHLASPASPLAYQRYPVETMQANAEGTRHLLELARQHGARFLFASTSEVYGDPLEHPQRESYRGNTNSTGPRSMYNESKRYGEALTTSYRNAFDVQTRIVRIFNTYGPRMAVDDGRVVSNFIVQALRNEPLTLYGEGSQTRSFQYVDDLIAGLTRLMESDYPRPVNIGNPVECTMRDLARLVIELTGSTSRIEYRALPGDDPRRRCPDIELAREVLGWAPAVSLREGLERTIPHFQRHLDIPPRRRCSAGSHDEDRPPGMARIGKEGTPLA
jgi:nucleoside-diphosphate-sugar epimerase